MMNDFNKMYAELSKAYNVPGLPKEAIGIIGDLMVSLDQPLVQPEIIRCKDCKHRDPEDKKCDCGHEIIWQLPRPDEWFCADGERRTEWRAE